jgi:hypothetical protein
VAVEYNIIFDKDEGLLFEFYYRTKATRRVLIPEGWTARMVMRDVASVEDPLELTTDSGHITLDVETGLARTRMSYLETREIKWREATFKWYLVPPAEQTAELRKKLFFGNIRKV